MAQPEFEDMVPRFLRTLFGKADRVVIARLVPQPGGKPGWGHDSQLCEEAILRVISIYRNQPNVYFRAASHDGSSRYTKVNSLRTRGLFLDLDYGRLGHKKPSPFDTVEDCTSYLLTMPLRPSIAWHTGHGVQACYLLDTPYVFETDGGPASALGRYERVSKRLSLLAMSDDTYSANHAFRIPLTVNSKQYLDPDTDIPDVPGQILWFEDRRYAFDDIERAVHAYGADEHMAEYKARKPRPVSQGAADTEWEALPADLRQNIQAVHAEGTRSESLFRVVARMVQLDCNDMTVLQAVRRGTSFVEKYDRRLEHETNRIIQKCRSGRFVYQAHLAPAIEIPNTPTRVSIDECPALPADLGSMLDKYDQVTARLSERVKQAARFHEHVFTTNRSGVLESPCGAGKSTWAMAHIALNARPDQRYLYVLETVDALYNAAQTLKHLTDTPVGRVHGFNREKCHQLCDAWRNWWECGAGSPSACHTCTAKAGCVYFNRTTEQTRPILCFTHNGFIRLLEDDSPLLDNANIIVDEGLAPFCTDTFTHAELANLQKVSRQVNVGALFPFSRLAHAQELREAQIDQADTFASRNYVYRDAQQTAGTKHVWDALRTGTALGLYAGNPFRPGDIEHERETRARLTNMFRPARQHDATYAFREIHDDQGLRYSVTRQRFDLETDRPYNKLWILNASAQLSPFAYPDDMPVYTCPDLPDNSHLMTIHAVRGNPTRSRQETNLRLTTVLQAFGPDIRRIRNIMVATNKVKSAYEEIEREVKQWHGQARIVHLTRGRIKGVNTAGTCELAHLTGMATFNGIDDCALHAALILRRTFPDRPYVFSRNGSPNWPKGMPIMPVMRNLFALRALDEIYQAVCRVCIRNDRPATAIVAVPDPEWLVALWRTTMPNFRMGHAYREKKGTLEVMGKDATTGEVEPQTASYDFEMDDLMAGLSILNMPAGSTIKKKQVAAQLGYESERGWETNKVRIMGLIGHAFDEVNARTLKRREDD
ncbi:MAG: hypothetical protein HN341_00875 [Verrucomicrobia bacterium]|nr:hypothetical protein [Verrucomicrobiota bacterium]